jgi:kinase
MSNTKLRGNIPPSLWTLPFLTKLEMSDNFLTGPLPSGPMSKEVQVLHLEMNQITGSIPDSLYNALNLAIFFLHENRMNGTISPNISNLQLLSRFTIDGNLVSGTVPSEIGSLRQLRDLSLSGTFLIGQVPTELCGLRKLGLSTLKADCLLDVNTGSSEIVCPEECCTTCCKADGTTCQIMDNP